MMFNSTHMILDHQTSKEPNVNDIKIPGNVVDSATLEVGFINLQNIIYQKEPAINTGFSSSYKYAFISVNKSQVLRVIWSSMICVYFQYNERY